MSLECWYYVAGIASAVLALPALIGLFYYASETKKLRVAAEEQIEGMSKPCVLFMEDASADIRGFDEKAFLIRNVGNGPAINIRWRLRKGADAAWVETRALAVGDWKPSSLLIKDVLNIGDIECEFESVSGSRYYTRAAFSQTGSEFDLRHSFKKLS